MNVQALISTARTLVVDRPSDEVMARLNAWCDAQRDQDQLELGQPHYEFDIWTYAIEGNDRTAFYDAMIKHQARMTDQLHMGCVGHWVESSLTPAVDMFERCLMMAAFLHYTDKPIAFLDNDAFPNADLRPVFDQVQHVGLTVRDTPGLMPVNEGVIFAKPTDEARRFFLSYLAEYERLRDTMAYDDWRWWGGQVALNAVAAEWESADIKSMSWDGIHRLSLLPCETYNYSPDEPQPRSVLDSKVVLHLKGPRKQLFDQLVAYQESR